MKKKGQFSDFLESLTDYELSVFIRYRFDGFLPGSRAKIIDEMNRRNITKDDLDELFKAELNKINKENLEICPRCGSDRLFIETDYSQKPAFQYASDDFAFDSIRCRLCGYNADKELPRNIFDRIKRIIKHIKSERIVH